MKESKESWNKFVNQQKKVNEKLLDQTEQLLNQVEEILNTVDQNLRILEEYCEDMTE